MWDTPYPSAVLRISKSGNIVCMSIPPFTRVVNNDVLSDPIITFTSVVPAGMRPFTPQSTSMPTLAGGNMIIPFFLKVSDTTGAITIRSVLPQAQLYAGTSLDIPGISIVYCV